MAKLYIVGTPIGNLGDVTSRMLETLKSVNTIACEDTRRTKHLLTHFGITGKRLLAHHLGNEKQSAQGLVKLLEAGEDMAYVSDGGMPTVSDPGFVLVKAALAAGVDVEPIPGPSAVTTALAAAGVAASRFVFLGFLPRKAGEQKKIVERFVDFPEALVIYEAPNRLAKTAQVLLEVLGNRDVCLARELTKQYEEFVRTNLAALCEKYANEAPQGECTLVVSGT